MSDSLLNVQVDPVLPGLDSSMMPSRYFLDEAPPGSSGLLRLPEAAAAARLFPEHTAARFFAARPEDYRRIAALIAEGVGIGTIAKGFGCGVGTIYAIRRREGFEIRKIKMQLSTRCREVAGMAIEAAAEALTDGRRDKMSAKDAALTAGILLDKGEALDPLPEPSKISVTIPQHDDYLRDLAKASAIGFGVGVALAAVNKPKEITIEEIRTDERTD